MVIACITLQFRESVYICAIDAVMNRKEEKSEGANKSDVQLMFDSIAWRYDFLNRFLSFGIDRYWRRKAIKIISQKCRPAQVLDVATGTADLAIAALKINPVKVTGIDISGKMLEMGRKKIMKLGLEKKIELINGDSENIPFEDNSFDMVMVAFGVRNFSNRLAGLKEMTRVLRKDGILMILEFSKPRGRLFSLLFGFYFFKILPVIGRIFSGHGVAYRYLPESVDNFPGRDEFMLMMKESGLGNISCLEFTGGIVSMYTGRKG